MSNEAPVSPGDVLAGKYRVDRVLGSGGMGVVVAATHVELGQKVALKFLLPAALENEEAAARFIREARAAVKIESEHVARVVDVGRLESGAPYMVMEYLHGHDLSDHPKGKDLPIETAVDFVLQACEAMAVAHTNGIIHRDLKPANLFLTTRPDGSPNVKVLDFGISKGLSGASDDMLSQSLTATRTVVGSPYYMSPEQVRDAKRVDERTDIWSLGMILYELIAGEPAFQAETLPGMCAAIAADAPPPLSTRRNDVPPALEALVMRCLEKDPGKRFQTIPELAAALEPFLPTAPKSTAAAWLVDAPLLRAAGPRVDAPTAASLELSPPFGGSRSGASPPAQGGERSVTDPSSVLSSAFAASATMVSPSTAAAPPGQGAEPPRAERPFRAPALLAFAVVALVGVGVVLFTLRGSDADATPDAPGAAAAPLPERPSGDVPGVTAPASPAATPQAAEGTAPGPAGESTLPALPSAGAAPSVPSSVNAPSDSPPVPAAAPARAERKPRPRGVPPVRQPKAAPAAPAPPTNDIRLER